MRHASEPQPPHLNCCSCPRVRCIAWALAVALHENTFLCSCGVAEVASLIYSFSIELTSKSSMYMLTLACTHGSCHI